MRPDLKQVIAGARSAASRLILVAQEMADRLIQCCREEDTVCRCGGDEFLALLLDPKSRDGIEAIVTRFSDSIRDPIIIKNQSISSVFQSALPSIERTAHPGKS